MECVFFKLFSQLLGSLFKSVLTESSMVFDPFEYSVIIL